MQWVISSFKKIPSLYQAYEKHLNSIIENLDKNPALSMEVCKTLLEGICKTILNDKNISIEDDTFGALVSKAFESINLDNHPNKEQIKVLLKRCKSISDYIADLRNNHCNFGSHGKDIDFIEPSEDLALLTMNATNTILGFLLHLYIKNRELGESYRLRYEDYPEFNEYFDENNSDNTLSKLGLSLSEAMFQQDEILYRDQLIAYLEDQNNEI